MRSLSSPRAVSMMIGTLRVSWRPRRRRQTSMPESCGNIQSRRTIGLFLGRDQERFLAVLRFEYTIAFAFQIVAQQGDQRAFVFGNKNRRLQAHAFLSKGTLVSLVVSALGRSFDRWSARTM